MSSSVKTYWLSCHPLTRFFTLGIIGWIISLRVKRKLERSEVALNVNCETTLEDDWVIVENIKPESTKNKKAEHVSV